MIAKADIRRVQEWMGHADIQTTMRYLHYAPREEDARLVAEAFHVNGAGPPPGPPTRPAGRRSTATSVGRSPSRLDRSGQRGSHEVWVHPERRELVVVAGKPGATVPAGTLASIRRASGLEYLR